MLQKLQVLQQLLILKEVKTRWPLKQKQNQNLVIPIKNLQLLQLPGRNINQEKVLIQVEVDNLRNSIRSRRIIERIVIKRLPGLQILKILRCTPNRSQTRIRVIINRRVIQQKAGQLNRLSRIQKPILNLHGQIRKHIVSLHGRIQEVIVNLQGRAIAIQNLQVREVVLPIRLQGHLVVGLLILLHDQVVVVPPGLVLQSLPVEVHQGEEEGKIKCC